MTLARNSMQHMFLTECKSKLVHYNKKVAIAPGTLQGRNQLLISGDASIMKFHSMTSLCLFNRSTTFSQTVTDNFLFATLPKMRTFQF